MIRSKGEKSERPAGKRSDLRRCGKNCREVEIRKNKRGTTQEEEEEYGIKAKGRVISKEQRGEMGKGIFHYIIYPPPSII